MFAGKELYFICSSVVLRNAYSTCGDSRNSVFVLFRVSFMRLFY